MAPNKRGGPISGDAAAQALREASVISAAEIAARGSGTSETADSYKGSCRDELRVFLTGRSRTLQATNDDRSVVFERIIEHGMLFTEILGTVWLAAH